MGILSGPSLPSFPYMGLLTAYLLIALPLPGYTSETSSEFVNRGATFLGQQKYQEAQEEFSQAATADPEDSEAWFFYGVTLNRLGLSEEAFAKLEKAAFQKETHPDLPFELGWSLIGLGRYQEAIVYLQEYEDRKPGRGQASEFLGRAYYELGEYDKAAENLEEALRRDPELEETVHFTLVLVEGAREKLESAETYFQDIVKRSSTNDPFARFLRPYFVTATRSKEVHKKPWHVSLSASGGYNDNVIGLSSQEFLPDDLSSESSPFARITFNAQYDWSITNQTILTAQYSLFSDMYSEISNFDLLDQSLSVTGTHHVNRNVTGTLQLSEGYALFGGSALRNQVGVRPSLIYRFTDWLPLEISYFFALSDYFTSTPAAQDRTGTAHTMSVTQYVQLSDSKIVLNAGYFRTWNNTNGSDFDSRIHGVRGGATFPLAWKISGAVSYTKTFDDYQHSNSLVNGAFKRDDQTDAVSVQLTRPINELIKSWVPSGLSLQFFMQYDFFQVDSNIVSVSFSQHVGSSGIVLSF